MFDQILQDTNHWPQLLQQCNKCVKHYLEWDSSLPLTLETGGLTAQQGSRHRRTSNLECLRRRQLTSTLRRRLFLIVSLQSSAPRNKLG